MSIFSESQQIYRIENNKLIKTKLTLNKDAFEFEGNRYPIDWENFTYETGTKEFKRAFKTKTYSYLILNTNGVTSPMFAGGQNQIDQFEDSIKSLRKQYEKEKQEQEKEKELKERQEAIQAYKNRVLQAQNECQFQLRLIEQYIRSNWTDTQGIAERVQQAKRLYLNLIDIQNEGKNSFKVKNLSDFQKEALEPFTHNPYIILGLSSNASKNDSHRALDKFKKLNKINSLHAYKTPFELDGFDKPERSLSIIQNAVMLLKDIEYKWFAFSDPEASRYWNSEEYISLLTKFGMEFGSYDLFLASYLHLLVKDPDFSQIKIWESFLKFYCFICHQGSHELLLSKFNQDELENIDLQTILRSFRRSFFNPLLIMCQKDSNNVEKLIAILKIIQKCHQEELEDLETKILEMIVSWFTRQEEMVTSSLAVLNKSEDANPLSEVLFKPLNNFANQYCETVNPVIRTVLSPESIQLTELQQKIIKESYVNATWGFIAALQYYKDRTYAIEMANQCIFYCSAQNQSRLLDAFGDNIRAIDKNDESSLLNARADELYYGYSQTDYKEAFSLYSQASEQGNKHGLNGLGLCYLNGYGTQKNLEMAADKFYESAIKGSPAGAFNLACCLQEGKGVEKDLKTALSWFRRAQELGHPRAADRYNTLFDSLSKLHLL